MTTLFVASVGGHLTQLDSLSRRLPSAGPEVWVTSAHDQSRSMLAGRDVQFVPLVGCRSLRGVVRCLPVAHQLWRDRDVRRAVSTGSGIALGFLPYLAARGVECHYIESATRVAGPSLTGSMLQWTPGIHVYTQYPHWAGRRWRYGGSQFDSYVAAPGARTPASRIRVVVTVGASEYPFRRLIESLVPVLADGGPLHRATGLPVDVVWQTGSAPVDDLPIQTEPFLPLSRLTAEMATADIVISHAGAGSALVAFEVGKLPLLVARDRTHGEAIDDHQRGLADELVRRGLARRAEAGALGVDDLLEVLGASVQSGQAQQPFELL